MQLLVNPNEDDEENVKKQYLLVHHNLLIVVDDGLGNHRQMMFVNDDLYWDFEYQNFLRIFLIFYLLFVIYYVVLFSLVLGLRYPLLKLGNDFLKYVGNKYNSLVFISIVYMDECPTRYNNKSIVTLFLCILFLIEKQERKNESLRRKATDACVFHKGVLDYLYVNVYIIHTCIQSIV